MHAHLCSVTRCYLVLAVLAGVPAGASRMVLCVAPEGHVAIEVGSGRCVESGPSAGGAFEPAGLRMIPDGCNDCVDVPVGTPMLSEANGRNGALGSQASVEGPFLSALALDMPAMSMPAPSAPRAGSHSAFPPSRTTILRN